jgi:uncharacterized protein (TIGR00299 family) protein
LIAADIRGSLSSNVMKTIRFDSVGGASGDMVLAALTAAGADLAHVEALLRRLPIETFRIESAPAVSGGLAGVRVQVHVPEEHHPHRRLSDIRGMIEASPLPKRVKRLSTRVFERLAEAEARVHGSTSNQVHFHEVGAMDSIIDVVGACAALDVLGAEAVALGPLPVGLGTTRGDHGVLPLPVPAVVELLKGFEVVQTEEACELVTPTGAALLTSWALDLPAAAGGRGRLLGAGYGVGHRTLKGRANVLRASLFESAEVAGGEGGEGDSCLVLECNLDDTVPELVGALTGRLLAAGALDVFTTAVQMKKQRPGMLLTVLARPGDRGAMEALIFAETLTFGIRCYPVERTVLARRIESVETEYGAVGVKVGTLHGRDITRKPEHDDCAARAAERGVPVRTVYEAALRAAVAAGEGRP